MKWYLCVATLLATCWVSHAGNSCEWKWGEWGDCDYNCEKKREGIKCEPSYCKDSDCGPRIEKMKCECYPMWKSWGEWSTCTKKKCKKQVRKRKCVWNCSYCEGKPKCKGKKKQTKKCPNMSYYDTWSSWDTCTQTCGGGSEMRTRTCHKVCKKPCMGESSETRACNNDDCDCYCVWGDYGECMWYNNKCQKKRECICPYSYCRPCDGSAYKDCPQYECRS